MMSQYNFFIIDGMCILGQILTADKFNFKIKICNRIHSLNIKIIIEIPIETKKGML